MEKVDNIIIGAGPGGYELAAELRGRGESVVIIEKDELGGTCLNRGCIPTKALCASAEAVLNARFAKNLGVETGEITIDFEKVVDRSQSVVNELKEGVSGLLSQCKIVHGEGRFVTNNRINVGEEEFEGERIIIATGSSPIVPDLPGKEFAITSDEALWLKEIPKKPVIVGGGVIGVELASIFSAFGSEVTVIEYCKEILPPFDAEIAKRLRSVLSKRGINFITGASVTEILRENSENDGETLTVFYQDKKGRQQCTADKVIMAVGRKPVLPQGFKELNGETDRKGFICVDEMMRTNLPGVYAVGDVNGKSMLAHSAYAQGRVVAEKNPRLFRKEFVPSVVFSWPELASVGLTPNEAEGRGEEFKTIKRPFGSNGKACASGHPEGLVKFVCKEDDTIIGVTILHHHAADLIAEATILVTEGIKLTETGRRFIHAHPTLSEIFC